MRCVFFRKERYKLVVVGGQVVSVGVMVIYGTYHHEESARGVTSSSSNRHAQ